MEFFLQYMPYLSTGAEILGYLTIAATAVAQMTKSDDDDSKVSKYSQMIWRVIDWLPTIGVNPKTKKIKKAYEELISN